MIVNINLVITSISNGNYSFLTTYSQFPNFYTKDFVWKNKITEFLEISPDWIEWKIIDVKMLDDKLNLFFGCLIPDIIKTKKGDWTPLEEMSDVVQKEICQETIRKIQ